jgi:hypothetical protein
MTINQQEFAKEVQMKLPNRKDLPFTWEWQKVPISSVKT